MHWKLKIAVAAVVWIVAVALAAGVVPAIVAASGPGTLPKAWPVIACWFVVKVGLGMAFWLGLGLCAWL
jgi:hypothetical protein